MRRAIVYAAAIATLLSGGAIAATEASAEARLADSQTAAPGTQLEREDEIRYATSDGRLGWSTIDVKRTIRAAVARWSVPGGYTFALSVARCESGADLLDSSSDGYTGTFQQSTRYWRGRRAAYNPPTWDKPLPMAAANPRANVVVSIRMAHGSGWDAWSCA